MRLPVGFDARLQYKAARPSGSLLGDISPAGLADALRRPPEVGSDILSVMTRMLQLSYLIR